MFGIGFGELIIIFVVALLVVGPHKLPQMAKNLARVLREVRKTSDEFQASFLRDTGADVKGFISNPQGSIKRHLENEVKEVLEGKEVSSLDQEQVAQQDDDEEALSRGLKREDGETSHSAATWQAPLDTEVVARTNPDLKSDEGTKSVG